MSLNISRNNSVDFNDRIYFQCEAPSTKTQIGNNKWLTNNGYNIHHKSSSLRWQKEFRTHIAVGIKLFFRILSGLGWQ